MEVIEQRVPDLESDPDRLVFVHLPLFLVGDVGPLLLACSIVDGALSHLIAHHAIQPIWYLREIFPGQLLLPNMLGQLLLKDSPRNVALVYVLI